jgi:UDP-N-acetylmuramoyl-L-alanyl-D-glutamate--2,6-diaminopimelate ligase
MVEDARGTDLPCLVIGDSRRASALAAAAAYGHPGSSLALVGVTGTNGKTTTVGLLRHLLDDAAAPAASIGTLGVLGAGGEALPGGSGLTTPGPVELQRLLRALADSGVRRIAMEVSSHSLEQRRVEGLRFAAAVFTNLTHEHLDYHGTMEAYGTAKARLVEYLAEDGIAVVNADDQAWNGLDAGASRRLRFGLRAAALDVTARDVRYGSEGSAWTLVAGGRSEAVTLPLLGDFNVMNALAAGAAAWGLGLDVPTIAARLSSAPQVPGRLERVLDHPTVLRDYAHKPHALESALRAVRPFTPGRLIVVVGCGGDRDRAKRPLMGAIAERDADAVILTSDNPRTEDPERILDEIETGMTRPHERIEDRREAIARALAMAGTGDVVVLAGKGHETYQIRGTTRLPFDEREIVRELAASRASGEVTW